MPPCAIVEADIAKIETTRERLFKIELHTVGEVETVFSRRRDVSGADGAHENRNINLIVVKPWKSPHIYNIYSFSRPQ